MAKKYYAVKEGRTPGIYETWAECQKQISGFSGAVYKSFASREEAQSFVSGASQKPTMEETQAVAYVDGSYDKTTGAFSYGMVMFFEPLQILVYLSHLPASTILLPEEYLL